MGVKTLVRKLKLNKVAKVRISPRWADIKKFGMKRARSRRIQISKIKKWRRSKIKI